MRADFEGRIDGARTMRNNCACGFTAENVRERGSGIETGTEVAGMLSVDCDSLVARTRSVGEAMSVSLRESVTWSVFAYLQS